MARVAKVVARVAGARSRGADRSRRNLFRGYNTSTRNLGHRHHTYYRWWCDSPGKNNVRCCTCSDKRRQTHLAQADWVALGYGSNPCSRSRPMRERRTSVDHRLDPRRSASMFGYSPGACISPGRLWNTEMEPIVQRSPRPWRPASRASQPTREVPEDVLRVALFVSHH